MKGTLKTSTLLPEVGDATTMHTLQQLQLSLDQLQAELDELSHRSSDLQDRKDTVRESKAGQHLSHGGLLLSLRSRRRAERSRLDEDPKTIDRELVAIHSSMQDLRQRHKQVAISIELYKAALAPISHLPFEILEQIFLHSLPPGFVKPSTRDSPLLLTLVCRKWRSIALSLPSLWSSISTTSDWPLQVFSPNLLSLQRRRSIQHPCRRTPAKSQSQPRLWIERAGNIPFHMEIIIPKNDAWFGAADPFYPWVAETSERWFHLRLNARAANLAHLLSKPMPKLEKLELVAIYDRSYDFYMLRTHYAEFNLNPSTFSFPWNSLTTLEASQTWLIVDQLLEILQGSPNLKFCTAKIQDIYTEGVIPYVVRHRITHVSLLSIRLLMNHHNTYALRRLLDSITVPCLTDLHIGTLNEVIRSDWPHETFVRFARKSQCPLRVLHVVGFSMTTRTERVRWTVPDRIHEIWLSFPMLEHFEFV